MKIPGWWRVRHFYYRNETTFLIIPNFFQSQYESLCVWLLSFKRIPRGINIIGYAKGDFGIAEHLRLVAHSIETQNVPFCVIDSKKTGDHSVMNTEMDQFITPNHLHKINLFCNNANFIVEYMNSYEGKLAMQNYYNIGYGYWELSEFPSEWHKQNEFLNEIWAPSSFIKEVIEKKATIPVHYMPIPVDFVLPVGFSRSTFNLPGNSFIFLFTFDMSSYIARKNPTAVIEAFSKAFPISKNDQVNLVLKINRVKHNPEQVAQFGKLVEQIKFDSRILIIDEILDRKGILGLISVCDVYVSLHRAEGFGLGMAEAMKMGKIVIGTNYSGNVDFMDSNNSCPVNYSLIDVLPEEYVFVESGAQWANPDLDHAAYFMNKVYNDEGFSNQLRINAKRTIDETRNFKVIGELYSKRYKEIVKGL